MENSEGGIPRFNVDAPMPQTKPLKSDFAEARRTMAKHLREDEGLRQTYEANVAMLLHDRHGITDYDKRNAAAKDILKLVFES